MSDDATPRLGLPYLAAAQAQKHVTMNAALALLDGLVSSAAESRTLAAQPAAPADGSLYILPAAPTGADWAAAGAGALMRFEAGAWEALAAADGQIAYVRDEAKLVARHGGAWVDVANLIGALQNLAALGIGATADANNPLIVAGPSALFTHSGHGMQVKLNKAAAGETASVLYQDGYSGRAEMGLCGDDGFHLKVSPDGSAWTEAFAVDGQGRIGLGTTPTSRLQVEGAVRVKTYSKAALPSASGEGSGAIIHVYDDSAGSTLAFSDGGSWRRVHDRQPVA
ncbi:MAG: DUF2793 domain-containing protein [Caulobacteraceae bacterium]|nr:DUF2793 domain-containing protein [Caulobacter sp.]